MTVIHRVTSLHRAVIYRFDCIHRSAQTKLRHENAAWLIYLSSVQNGGNNVRILVFFGDEFHKKHLLALETESSASGAKLSERFLLALTKNIRFLE